LPSALLLATQSPVLGFEINQQRMSSMTVGDLLKNGYHPEIILAGRRLNYSMGDYVANQIIKTMIKKDIKINGAQILIVGITFKENCPDVRNTKIVAVIGALKDYSNEITLYDPWANPVEVIHEYGLHTNTTLLNGAKYDVIVLGAAHQKFVNLDLKPLLKDKAIVYDVKEY
jgi:UDP-N-acetyl-D-galactosamine dehydrogenase